MTREDQVKLATLRVQLRESQVEGAVLRDRNAWLVRARESLKRRLDKEVGHNEAVGGLEREVRELRLAVECEQAKVKKLQDRAIGVGEIHAADLQKLRDAHSRDRVERQEQHAVELEKLGQRYEAMLSTNAMQAPRMSLALSNILRFIDHPDTIPGIVKVKLNPEAEVKAILSAVHNCAAIALVPVPDMSQMGKSNG